MQMTIYEVLQTNIRILENIRIPVREKEIADAVRGVMENELACLRAMEQDAAARREKREREMAELDALKPEPDPPEDNVTPMPGCAVDNPEDEPEADEEDKIRQFGEDRNG